MYSRDGPCDSPKIVFSADSGKRLADGRGVCQRLRDGAGPKCCGRNCGFGSGGRLLNVVLLDEGVSRKACLAVSALAAEEPIETRKWTKHGLNTSGMIVSVDGTPS